MRFSSIIVVAAAMFIVASHGEAKPPKYDSPEPLLPNGFLRQSATMESSSAKTPKDWLHLANSSFLGGSRDLLIDLDTGMVVDRARGMATPNNPSPSWHDKKGQISGETVNKLRGTIRTSLASGLESEQCKRDEEAARRLGQRFIPTPALDGVSELTVSLDGRMSAAPQLSCQSRAVDDIWRAALQATQNMTVEPIAR